MNLNYFKLHISFLVIAILILLPSKINSQNHSLSPEIEKELARQPNDSLKVDRMFRYILEFQNIRTDTALILAQRAHELSKKIKSLFLLTISYGKLGDVYWYKSDYSKAMDYYFKQLKIADSTNQIKSIAKAYYNIGWIKCLQQESYKDRYYLLKALNVFEKLRDTASVYNVCSALGSTYKLMSKSEPKYVDSALYFYRNLVYYSEHKSKNEEYNIIIHATYADLLTQIGRYKEAKTYLLKCCEEAEKSQKSSLYLYSKKYLAALYFKTDSITKAKEIYDEIIPKFEMLGDIEELVSMYFDRSEIYKKEKKYKEALEMYILYKQTSDSVAKGVFKPDILQQETDYEIDKRESNIRKLENENEISELKNKQNKYVIFGLLFIAVLIIGLAFNLMRSNKAKQLANKLLNQKNHLIEEQKKAVEEKNTDITNSINYAKRIQEAILPAKELKYVLFPNAFVLFQPKDIVSGDFYWFAEKNNKRLISAIDCTGHGVPGAFMSMIGNAFLHEAVNEKGITEPGLILNELRTNIITSLKQSDVADSTKDGMDMALLSFNANNTQVEFAGANNPLWIIRNGECIEYKGDKRPIGYYLGKGLPFTNNVIDLVKGDTLYIFTDGFADQFGGPAGKKYKYKQLKDNLLSIQHLSMPEQELFLLNKLNSWKGILEQVDDVCVIGIRV